MEIFGKLGILTPLNWLSRGRAELILSGNLRSVEGPNLSFSGRSWIHHALAAGNIQTLTDISNGFKAPTSSSINCYLPLCILRNLFVN